MTQAALLPCNQGRRQQAVAITPDVDPCMHFGQAQSSWRDALRPVLVPRNHAENDLLVGLAGETAPQIARAQRAADPFPGKPNQCGKPRCHFTARRTIANPVSNLLDDQVLYADRLQARR